MPPAAACVCRFGRLPELERGPAVSPPAAAPHRPSFRRRRRLPHPGPEWDEYEMDVEEIAFVPEKEHRVAKV
ncbi:hypothetical protein GUJ93_ZPchr0013g37243 [Zizania palustris]|uniref:Uncharacterized protein n=1 Tax=Zizania palustris TaxID=103762 RepID=A0A8J5WYH1_ZIZPA|nr:hypothetical protein GUJ93_ZPchr0013g37243 [Zizania palustris]